VQFALVQHGDDLDDRDRTRPHASFEAEIGEDAPAKEFPASG
jgi:hypothetical protein